MNAEPIPMPRPKARPMTVSEPMANAYNLELEAAVLGVLLDGRHKDAWGTFADHCPHAGVFWKREHRLVALVMYRLAAEGRETDALTVVEAAQQIPFKDAMATLAKLDEEPKAKVEPTGGDYSDSVLAAIGGATALLDMAQAFAPASGIEANTKAIVGFYRQRRLISILADLTSKAQGVGGKDKVAAITDDAINRMSALTGSGQGARSAYEGMVATLNEHDAASVAGDSIAATWGVPSLDSSCRLDLGRLVVLAARPGCGKTSLMLQSAAATVQTMGPESACIVTLEMPTNDLSRILVGREIGVGRNTITRGWMNDGQRASYVAAMERWKATDIPIKDHGDRCNVDDICAWIRTRYRRSNGKLALACIDYLQLVSGTNAKHNENDRIGEITRKLKLLTLGLRITILLLCQMNRESAREQREPELTDLRGSGNIEQDADAVAFLWSKDHSTAPSINVIAKVAKNRGGDCARVGLEFMRANGQVFREIGQRTENHRNTAMSREPSDSEDLFA